MDMKKHEVACCPGSRPIFLRMASTNLEQAAIIPENEPLKPFSPAKLFPESPFPCVLLLSPACVSST